MRRRPFVEIIIKPQVQVPGDITTAKPDIQEINMTLDVAGGDGMLALAHKHTYSIGMVQKLVGFFHGTETLFRGPEI